MDDNRALALMNTYEHRPSDSHFQILNFTMQLTIRMDLNKESVSCPLTDRETELRPQHLDSRLLCGRSVSFVVAVSTVKTTSAGASD